MASAKWRPFCLGLNVLIDKQAEKLHKKHFVPVYNKAFREQRHPSAPRSVNE